MPINTPIIGHASHEALTLITEGIEDTIPQIDQDESMTVLTNLDDLPKSVRVFVGRLQPNIIAVFDKEGTVYIEISLNILRNTTCFQMFLSFYHSLLAEFPDLKPYISMREATELCHQVTQGTEKLDTPIPIWITRNFYVTINVPDLLIEKLHSHFLPDEYPTAESFSYLLAHGFDKEALSTTFNVSRTTLFKYQAKNKKSNDCTPLEQNGTTD